MAAAICTLRVELQGSPGFTLIDLSRWEREAWGHDGDNRCRLAVEISLAADNLRVSSEHALPQAIRQHEYLGSSGCVVGRREEMPEQRLDLEKLRNLGGDGCSGYARRLMESRDVGTPRKRGSDGFEGFDRLLDIEDFGFGNPKFTQAAARESRE